MNGVTCDRCDRRAVCWVRRRVTAVGPVSVSARCELHTPRYADFTPIRAYLAGVYVVGVLFVVLSSVVS